MHAGCHVQGGNARKCRTAAVLDPAGMTNLPGKQVLLGTTFLFGDIEFNVNAGNSTTEPPRQSNGGGNIGSFAPIGSAYAVLGLTGDLNLGFAFNALYGGSANYADDWVGRTFVTDVSLVSLNIEPALAYRLTDWLSIGAGLNIVYATMNFEARASSAANAPATR